MLDLKSCSITDRQNCSLQEVALQKAQQSKMSLLADHLTTYMHTVGGLLCTFHEQKFYYFICSDKIHAYWGATSNGMNITMYLLTHTESC